MITIETINLTSNSIFARLSCQVDIDGKTKELYVETYKKWISYLNNESGDSFLIALIPFALFNKHDIISKVPISEDLLYGINYRLSPILNHFDNNVHKIKVHTEITGGGREQETTTQ